MTETGFSIVYDGEPVSEGTIDARDLAPALLALADLFDEAAPLVDPNLPRISLRVKPNFKDGSFEIFLDVTGLYSKLVSIFSTPDAQAWSALFQILGISGVLGILQFIKRSRGRKPTRITVEKTEKVTITFEGNDSVQIDKRVWKLFQNSRARKAIEKLISPLSEKGYELFKIRHQDRETCSVSRDEARYFVAPDEHEGETSAESETRLVIVAPSFNPGNKWRVSDGGRTIHVSLNDEVFVRAVQQGAEAFRKGDTLHVTLRTTQWLEEGKLLAEYAIVKVHNHEQAPQQKRLI